MSIIMEVLIIQDPPKLKTERASDHISHVVVVKRELMLDETLFVIERCDEVLVRVVFCRSVLRKRKGSWDVVGVHN